MQKLGGMGGVLGMLPGVAKIKGQINEAGLDKSLVHQRAIISSMTPKERRNPKILDARRKRRIASGAGAKVEEINKLLKMHRQMADMMKSMGRNGGMLNKFLGRTGAGPSEAEMQSMQAELAKLDPKALEQLPDDLKEQLVKGASAPAGGTPSLPPGFGRGLPGLGGGLPKGLPGLGGGMPKFPGFPGKKR
jgi:signal recognition particle subunit SRP54